MNRNYAAMATANRLPRLFTEASQDTQRPLAALNWPCANPALLLHNLRDRKHLLFPPGAANNLHSNRKAFRRASHRNYCGGVAEQIKELRVTPCVEVVNLLPFDDPTSLSVPKGGNRCSGAKKN